MPKNSATPGCPVGAVANYSTTIAAHKTVGEIQHALAQAGAASILVEYNPQGWPIALAFQLNHPCGKLAYKLPCRHLNVLARLQQDGRVPRRQQTEWHALCVAWRTIQDWIYAQLELIHSDLATINEVFMPYQLVNATDTAYTAWQQNRLLTTASEEQP